MKQRFNVSTDGKRFASIIAETAEEAVRMACRVTGRQPEGCEAVPVSPGVRGGSAAAAGTDTEN
jgi:hypothetical protein